MTVGAEPKKVAILGGLLLVAGVLFYNNLTSGPDGPGPAAAPAPAPPPRPNIARPAPATPQRGSTSPSFRRSTRGAAREYKFSMKLRPEDRPDPTKIDPTLRIDLLARVQKMELGESRRSIFQFGAEPPKVEEVKDAPKIKPKPGELAANGDPKPAKPGAPAKAPPPPITLKFYGYAAPWNGGIKRAFFLDGEDIFVAAEGEIIKKRYKVIRIGANSVVMEDTQHDHQQTLILPQEQG